MKRNAGAIMSEESFINNNSERNVVNGNKVLLEEQSWFRKRRS
jgi:hypothetical protein